MTRVLPFPKTTRFVDRSKAGTIMVLFYVSGSFLLPLGLRLLIEVVFLVTDVHSWSAVISVSFRSTFISALVTRCFAVEGSVRYALTYFRKPMLATRCVENLLKFAHVRKDRSVNMRLWLPNFITKTFNFEWRK